MRAGWQKLGLSVSTVAPGTVVPVESRKGILAQPSAQRLWTRVTFAGRVLAGHARSVGRRTVESPTINLVDYKNNLGQDLRGIVDTTPRVRPGSPAVLVPPAWGRTKETLLPLARTLIESFEAAGESLTVLRFDGTQRRGESYIDDECREPHNENLHFTYSQAAHDLLASAEFLKSERGGSASRIVLVTFSLAAIEGRRALAHARPGLFAGWVPVVGMADVQSAMKAVSGGVDYVLGAQLGIEFGVHELGGVRIDIDRAAADVLRHDLGGFEDAREDMAAITVPITWIHGRHDGWTDLSRVRELVSAGDDGQRRVVDVPTGHQLRNSQEALDTFQLITEEVTKMVGGSSIPARLPSPERLNLRSIAERSRVPSLDLNVDRFWRDYLVGKDGTVGMQLFTATSAYTKFMRDQLDLLRTQPGSRILDFGCGTGEFYVHASDRIQADRWSVVAVDLVHEAIKRARRRTHDAASSSFVVLDADGPSALPFRSGSFDAVVASLVICYLDSPLRTLRELRRIVRPGGHLVLSSPRRDADLSSLYRDMMNELSDQRVGELFGSDVASAFDAVQRNYLNEAARLIDIEESGRFRFLDPEELVQLVEEAGFAAGSSRLSLGSPPQVGIVQATALPESRL